MIKEELKKYITNELEHMECKNIKFLNGEDDFMIVFFDCDNLISFRRTIPEWEYLGIELNKEKREEGLGKYKIEFKKIQQPEPDINL